jgi:glycosyltransferase involved in cell wall biosynthesis
MKPKILHILSDYKLGGIRSNVENLLDSRLCEHFDFSILLLEETQKQRQKLRQLKPDIIILHSASSWANIFCFLSLKLNAKLIICEHHYYEIFDALVPSLTRFRFMLKLAYGFADRVVAFSHSQACWIRGKLPLHSHNLVIIPQARDLGVFLQVPPPQFDQPVLRLGSYGRFSEEKGFEILLKALHLIPHVPVHLYLGGEGPEQSNLEALAQNLTNVEFKGAIHNVPKFLETCDAIVVPSLREMWGYVCMEAKAAARPVLASHVGGLVEQIESCDCGILVPPGDPHALAAGITQLQTLPRSTLQAWGQRGRESVQGAWEQYLNQWENTLCELLTS